MTWAVITFIVAWMLGWAAFLQSTYYNYLKDFSPDEMIQSKAAFCQLSWALGGVLTLTYAGIIVALVLA